MWARSSRSMLLVWVVVLLLTTILSSVGPTNSKLGWGNDGYPSNFSAVELASSRSKHANEEAGWIVKWKSGSSPDPAVMSSSSVLSVQETMNISVMKPAEGVELKQWMKLLHASPDVQYVEPNQQVQTLAVHAEPNDQYYNRQYYLKQTGVDQAWNYLHSENKAMNSSNLTVALIDTGVDLEHPDLKPNLTKGINLLHDGLPKDDNGHGTSVAGVIAAVGNNFKGIAGVSWNTKVMPIKALDSRGYGDEDKLGAGILYAVDNGAKIVVMSVGLYRYSKYMQDIVDYAEQKGVLLIAATGNDAMKLEERAAVKYPAAYPTVLAVGGVTPLNRVEARSNRGPEVDIVAPWHVYTTALGGGTREQEGTSMAAPQVAGVAALLWNKHPDLKPYQIRDHLRMTAEDIEDAGWDPSSGYGLLRAERVVQEPIKREAGVDNRTKNKATIFPIDTSRSGYIDDNGRSDWYRVDVPYDGTLQLKLERIVGNGTIEIRHEHEQAQKVRHYSGISRSISLPVKKGKHYIRIRQEQATVGQPFAYKISSRFIIYEDPFEPNDEQYKAHMLPARNQQIVGTFSHTRDADWYRIQLDTKTTLKLKVTTTTARIDPLITMKSTEWKESQFFDETREGETETVVLEGLNPGKYDIKIQNAVTSRSEPASGLYKMEVEILPQYSDPNEPNNKMYEAISIVPQYDYSAVVHAPEDEDWYQFKVTEPVNASLRVSQIPQGRKMDVSLQTKRQEKLVGARNERGQTKLVTGTKLEPGTYYIQVRADAAFSHQPYKLRLELDKLTATSTASIGDGSSNEQSSLNAKPFPLDTDEEMTLQSSQGDAPSSIMTRADRLRLWFVFLNWLW
ncbi:S8 family peptidase [Paenibacillus assamensis]|uniref:S8 family peptidase n=1 Tax=Paenibacillus assamensis TaxID=311244 RepID=UPI000685EE22|nr:S8 family serine peptidase [Paenibacillus assamensis]